MGFFTGAYAFIAANMKWVAIVAIVALAGSVFWVYTNAVQDKERLTIYNKQLEQTIIEKERNIITLQELSDAREKLLIELTEEVEELSDELGEITDDLGDDSKEKAVASIRELLKRLRDQQ